MAQSIKLGSDTYLDSTGVVVDNAGTTLATRLATDLERGCGCCATGNSTDYRHYTANFTTTLTRCPVLIVINHQTLGANAGIVQGYIASNGSGNFTDPRVTASGGVITIDAGASAYAPQMILYPLKYATIS